MKLTKEQFLQAVETDDYGFSDLSEEEVSALLDEIYEEAMQEGIVTEQELTEAFQRFKAKHPELF